MKALLFFMFSSISQLSLAQNKPIKNPEIISNCFELEVNCSGIVKFSFENNQEVTPPIIKKGVKKNDKIVVKATFGLDNYYSFPYHVDPNRTSWVQATEEVVGTIAHTSGYNTPQMRSILADLVKSNIIKEVTYTLYKCE